MTKEFNNIWIWVDVLDKSKPILEHISTDIKNLFENNWFDFKIPKKHHMTLWHYNSINSDQLIKIISFMNDLKIKKENIKLTDSSLEYDQTLHKLDYRRSNVNNKLYFVLIPHNPDNIFKDFIGDSWISPHISLWSTSSEIDIDFFVPKIKEIRDIHIKEWQISVDLSKINIKF